MSLALHKQSKNTLRPCNSRFLPNRPQASSGTITGIKGQLIVTPIEDMICWKPYNLILILLMSMTERPNYTGNSLLQAEGTHFTKITHSLFSVKDAMNYKVLHCAPVLMKTQQGFNFSKPQAFDPWKTAGF